MMMCRNRRAKNAGKKTRKETAPSVSNPAVGDTVVEPTPFVPRLFHLIPAAGYSRPFVYFTTTILQGAHLVPKKCDNLEKSMKHLFNDAKLTSTRRSGHSFGDSFRTDGVQLHLLQRRTKKRKRSSSPEVGISIMCVYYYAYIYYM